MISVHLSRAKPISRFTDSEFIASAERSLKAVIPFELEFKPLVDAMKQRKKEVDKRARVAHEVFSRFPFPSVAIRGFAKSYELYF